MSLNTENNVNYNKVICTIRLPNRRYISAFGIQWPSRSKTYLIEWWETEENQTTLSTINQMNQCLMCKVQFHFLINIYYITDILVIIVRLTSWYKLFWLNNLRNLHSTFVNYVCSLMVLCMMSDDVLAASQIDISYSWHSLKLFNSCFGSHGKLSKKFD